MQDIVDTLAVEMGFINKFIKRVPYCKNSFCDRFHWLYTSL